ncbi:MAG: hypothetical protein IPK76_03580 [Lewinellaceae bacterium]|nr:hypothetical protein [Lewinellaceae bacterium]
MERFERRKTDFAKAGLYQRFHQDGHLVEEAHFVNDTLHGERKFFFPNGKVERIEHHQHGVMHGKYEQFYESGQLQLAQEFVNGVLEGISTAWFPNGQKKKRLLCATTRRTALSKNGMQTVGKKPKATTSKAIMNTAL